MAIIADPRKIAASGARARFLLMLLIALVSPLSLTPPAAADSTAVVVTGGLLAVDTPDVTPFSVLTLDGSAATLHATLDVFTVTDARGTGAGWSVLVQATPVREFDPLLGDYVTGGRTLPTGSLSMSAPAITAAGTISPRPSIEPGAPWALDGPAVKIASAAIGAGMGRYDFDGVALSLNVPASTHAAAYRSDVSVSVVSGP